MDNIKEAIIKNARINEKNYKDLKDQDKAILDTITENYEENTNAHNELSQGIGELDNRVTDVETGLNDLELIQGEKGEPGESIVGPQGPVGPPGKDGKTPVAGIDFPLPKDGIDGEDGETIVGPIGPKGEKGNKPDHKWNGTKLAFELPNGEWGKYVDLRGKSGSSGVSLIGSNGTTNHSNLINLTNDDHLQYFNLNGRSSGQTAYGGTDSLDNLTLYSNISKDGHILFGDTAGYNETDQQLWLSNDPYTYGIEDPNVSLYATREVDDYHAWNIANLSTGTRASVDILAYNDHPTAYVTMGMTGTNNDDPATALLNGNASYLFSVDSPLYIGSGANEKLHFFSGGTDDPMNIKMTMDNDKLGIGTQTPTQLVDIYNGNFAFSPLEAPVAPTAVLENVAGNITPGTHKWVVTYLNSYGETDYSAASNIITVITSSTDGQVTLTIPVSTDTGVARRAIYRTKAGGTTYFYAGIVSNNVDTTWTDNLADSSLVTVNVESTYLKENTAGAWFYRRATKYGLFGKVNFSMGANSLASLTYGFYNTAMGNGALYRATSGSYNSALGANALLNLTTGQHNQSFGSYAAYNLTTGSFNISLGTFTNAQVTTENNNVAIGNSVFRSNKGAGNVGIGYATGYLPANLLANASTADNNCVYIGNSSGNATTGGLTNAMAFGYFSTVGASNTIAMGGTGANAMSMVIGATTARSTLDVRGSLSLAYVEKTANYTLTANDYTVNCTANTFTITLPTAVGITGRIYNIKNSGAGVITVDGDGTETIDGETSQTVDSPNNMSIQSTGSNWIII